MTQARITLNYWFALMKKPRYLVFARQSLTTSIRILRRRLGIYLSHPSVFDMLFRLMVRQRQPSEGFCSLVLAAPGRGNVGDRAMLEALIEHLPTPVSVILRESSDYLVLPESVAVLELPSLLYGGFPAYVRDVIHFSRTLKMATSLSIVGADIMDGAYNSRASARRAIIAKWAARSGVDTRVIGFSWNDSPTVAARQYIREAAEEGVQLFVRDPDSRQRLHRDGVENLREAADVVFTVSERVSLGDLFEIPTSAYVVINASALVGGGRSSVSAYTDVIEAIVGKNLSVVLLPHVVRAQGDQEILNAIFAKLLPQIRNRVLLIDSELSPSQVREIASKASFVVTGRMHLAIMALRFEVPAVVVGTQGKVEGMMELFGLRRWTVPVDGIASGAVLAAVEDLQLDLHACQKLISARLPRVIALAERNLDGLH